MRILLASILVLTSVHGAQGAQNSTSAPSAPSAAGEWRVQFVTPLGQHVLNMTINQSGTKLTGQATDEYGEYAIEGRLVDDVVTVVWSVADDGKLLEITMKGTLEGNEIRGVARLGDVGEGTLVARRTSAPAHD
jgi:hypothetical protein